MVCHDPRLQNHFQNNRAECWQAGADFANAFQQQKTQKGILCRPQHGDPPHLFQLVTFYNDGSSVFEKRLVGGKDEVRKQQGQEMFNSRVAIRQDTNPQEPQSDSK